jgi:hypothetical protein
MYSFSAEYFIWPVKCFIYVYVIREDNKPFKRLKKKGKDSRQYKPANYDREETI